MNKKIAMLVMMIMVISSFGIQASTKGNTDDSKSDSGVDKSVEASEVKEDLEKEDLEKEDNSALKIPEELLNSVDRIALVKAKDIAEAAVQVAKLAFEAEKNGYDVASKVTGFVESSPASVELKEKVVTAQLAYENALKIYKDAVKAILAFDKSFFETHKIINGLNMTQTEHHLQISLSQQLREKIHEQMEILQEEKAKLEIAKNEAEAAYEAAVKLGTATEEDLNKLKTAFIVAKEALLDKISEIKALINSLKVQIQSEYTEDEKIVFEDNAKKVKERNPKAHVLDGASIFSKGKTFEMDTPPVIKEGRTLIPVRAITEGFGAKVVWDPATNKVTISKDNIQIVLILGQNTATVTDLSVIPNVPKTVQLDSSADVMNNRTYVPLRFVLETYGFKLDWNQDTSTINIQ